MEQLTNPCDKVSIDNEEAGLVVDQGENEPAKENLKWHMVGRFFIDRVIHPQAMKSPLSAIWRIVKGVLVMPQIPGVLLIIVNVWKPVCLIS